DARGVLRTGQGARVGRGARGVLRPGWRAVVAGRGQGRGVALAVLARPDAVGVAAHGVEVPAGEHAVRRPLDERRVVGIARLGVATLDQEPAGLAAVARARPHAHQVPAAAQLLAGQLEGEVALLEA